jgi:hypothetical protein
MATSRWLPACLIAVAIGGCGGTSAARQPKAQPPFAAVARASSSSPSTPASSDGFGWLQPAPAPAGWASVRIASGATLAYPGGWRQIRGDRGTASAALIDSGGHYLGYLNLTPRQGSETLAGWAAFRLHHNAEEGDRDLRALGAASGLRFRGGHGACVRDSYATTVARYEEIACLVTGAHGGSVIVAAAPPALWAAESGTLERAIRSISA